MYKVRRYGIVFLIMFVASLTFAHANSHTVESDGQASAPGMSKAPSNHFVTEPFDMNTSTLSPNFAGNDPQAVYDALFSLKDKAKKDEFETTSQYQQRMHGE